MGRMRRNSALAGLIGLVLLIFAAVDFVIAGGFRFFLLINLIGGLLGVVSWLLSGRAAIGALAGGRAARYGANAALYSVAFIGILVAINYLSTVYHRRVDLTEEKVFSLSPQSIQIVKSLDKPLQLYGFFEAGQSAAARNLYDNYSYVSHQVSAELVDPDQHPELAEKYKVTVMGTTHIQYGGDEGQGTNVTDLSEEGITNAILKVTRNGKQQIYFTEGHGESDTDDEGSQSGFGALGKALQGEGFEIKKVLLASVPSVPNDCALLVLAGPQKPLAPRELDEITDYLHKKGKVMVMLRPIPPDSGLDEAGIGKLAADWGVKAGDDIVVDQVVRLFAGPTLGLTPLVETYGAHPITRNFTQRTVFPMTRSVEPDDSPKPGLTVTALAKTSDTSWAETDLKELFEHQTAQFDAKDRHGPITVCDAVEADLKTLKLGDGQARLVIFGDTDFADNQYINQFYNRDFMINAADWLTGEENQIAIRPRELRASRFRLTVDQFAVVFALSVLMLPEFLLIIGIVVWWERRN
jgi:ABC-type uncharacterized transport system involved in gliding motility auxiliary subunit